MTKRHSFGKILKKKNANGKIIYYVSYIGSDGVRYNAPHSFVSKNQAEYFLTEQKTLITFNQWKKPKLKQDIKKNELLFNDYAIKHLKERQLAETSRERYFNKFNLYIKEYFNNKSLINITQADIKDWLNNLKSNIGGKNTSINHSITLLKLIFNQAIKDEIIEKSPAIHIKKEKTKNRLTVSNLKNALLSENEINELIKVTPDKYKLIIVLGAYCGTRISEALSLQIKNIDLTDNFILIDKSVYHKGGKAIIKETKNYKERYVPIPPQAIKYFNYHLNTITKNNLANTYIFARSKDNMPIARTLFNKCFIKCRNAINRPAFRYHDLRHTCLTYYARSGATIKDLMEIAGHSTPDIVMLYQETSKERLTELASKLRY